MAEDSLFSSAVTQIDPTAPQALPVPAGVISQHREMQKTAGPHPLKDRVYDQDEPSFEFDVADIEAAIQENVVPTQQGTWPTDYARKVWKLEYSDNVISQGEGSSLDLIWVATMPPTRQEMPVLIIKYPSGCSFLDGSHRLARAFMDGKQHHPSLIIQREDALAFRKVAVMR